MKSLEIYFDDLNEEKKAEVLEFYGMKDESEGNWEINALAILEVDNEQEAE